MSKGFLESAMPDKRRHRGPHPMDHKLFGDPYLGVLREAVADYSLLLTKGYAEKASLKLVGDHLGLTARQRLAVLRSSCSGPQVERRRLHQVPMAELRHQRIAVDGYNLLITVEVALSGGYLFAGRDGCLRDLAGLHGTYRRVEETLPGLALIGQALSTLDVIAVHWILDQPVSNSGRLKGWLLESAQQWGWPWEVTLAPCPDRILSQSEDVVLTGDSVILDQCSRWANLGAWVINKHCTSARVIDLGS